MSHDVRISSAMESSTTTAGLTRPASYKQTFRRHRLLLSLPIILGVIAAGAIVATHKATFQSSASLWIDTAPPIASSVGSAAAVLPNQPAAAEQSVLNELLATQAFAISVARSSALGAYLSRSGPLAKTAPAALESQQVTAVVAGPQVLQITYKGPNATVAQSTLRAIVSQLQSDSNGLSAEHENAAVRYDQAQVAQATAGVTSARTAAAAYLARHPHASSQSDPNLAALNAAENTASQQLGQAEGALSQASASRSEGGWLVQVLDPPRAGTSLAYGKKKMLETVLGGALAGVLISLLGTIALTPAPPSPWEDEIPVSLAPMRRREEQFEPELAGTGAPARFGAYAGAASDATGQAEFARERRFGFGPSAAEGRQP
jgi:uncharacterized protein involved in exopolysaccharide biosynthesis